MSLTLPIIDNSNPAYVLGYMTVVAAATALLEVISSKEGLGDTGIVLIVGVSREDIPLSRCHVRSGRPAILGILRLSRLHSPVRNHPARFRERDQVV